MRGIPNRQQVSSTSRWNLTQSDPNSVGAQKRPVKNQQTGQGTNIVNLQRALAAAELHFAQTYDPRVKQNMEKGINALKAQIARASGVDPSGFDLNTVTHNPTGFEFLGHPDASDFDSTRDIDVVDQPSVISPFAAFQLLGTLRQKITKVSPPSYDQATPGGTYVYVEDPNQRTNVLRTPNNPEGSTFPTGKHDLSNFTATHLDTRDTDYRGRLYLQGVTPDTHDTQPWNITGRGVVPSDQTSAVRGKHGQYKGGYTFQGDGGY